jgi:hypothetical protein
MSDAIENEMHCIDADRGKLYVGSNPIRKVYSAPDEKYVSGYKGKISEFPRGRINYKLLL